MKDQKDQKIKKNYDLADRTRKFAKDVRSFVQRLPRTISSIEDAKQLVRSSGSVGANYIEACDALSKKDFGMRMKISRKEASESRYWLDLIDVTDDPALNKERLALFQEATELSLIFGSIVQGLNPSDA